jgi:hypothetical protein
MKSPPLSPGLPFAVAQLDDRWPSYALTLVAWRVAQPADGEPTESIDLTQRGHVQSHLPANLSEDDVRGRFLGFARNVSDASVEEWEVAADGFLASRQPGSYGAPGGGVFDPSQGQEKVLVAYLYEGNVPGPFRLAALFDEVDARATREDLGRATFQGGAWSFFIDHAVRAAVGTLDGQPVSLSVDADGSAAFELHDAQRRGPEAAKGTFARMYEALGLGTPPEVDVAALPQAVC